MKKIVSIIICLAMLVSGMALLTACSEPETDKPQNETTQKNTGEIVGGWSKADSLAITDDFRKVFDKAFEKFVGAEYTPVAYLASQVVAGTNHCVLCKAKPVVPDAPSTYAIVTIYEDLEGNAEVTDIASCNVNADYANNDGGWAEAQAPAVTDDAKKVLEKATETLTGAEYTPVALLGTQVVAGVNYRLLCESRATVPDAESEYIIVTLYADLDGNAEITETAEFQAAEVK